jgi:hypothetical protein
MPLADWRFGLIQGRRGAMTWPKTIVIFIGLQSIATAIAGLTFKLDAVVRPYLDSLLKLLVAK